ncbi:putative LRR receptor-like serine/threonine-protein kinase [Gossypium australe]|uniref:Putative LRR receptor-like serine/threonine-protein kinase n=1 Tax=Gossypium australe TaxID=47621 RepID=A0A5B6WTZ6_9ROSI|nr:putative LRR receptor-like serine/threonine-protein kinase [Gossypium australe]
MVLLSTDGAVARDSGHAASRGVVRDREGNWIMGFGRYLGVCSPFEVKAWSILDGILLLLNKGFRRVIIQTDSLEVVQALNDLGIKESGVTVLRRAQRTMRLEGQWRILHIPREHNLVADRLAKLSLNCKSILQIFDEAPTEI